MRTHRFQLQQIIGRPISDFLEEGSGDGPELIRRALPRFIKRRHWSGIIQVRLKKQNAVCYYDCVAHAMTRDNEVHGLTVLGRESRLCAKTRPALPNFSRRSRKASISLFPWTVLDVNPALVRMLGYETKEELLAKRVPEIFTDYAERKSIIEEVERQPSPQGREITLLRKDGSSIYCLNTTSTVRDTSGP